MKSDEEFRKLAGGSAGAAIGPIVGIVLIQQDFTKPILSSSNLILLLVTAVAAAISAVISFKIGLRLNRTRPHDALVIGAGIGALVGSSLYLLLVEVFKQLQQ